MNKICYCIDGLYNSGGMERVLVTCANALVDDYDITVLTYHQNNRPQYFQLCDDVHYFDLGIEDVGNKRVLRQRLSEFLFCHHFNVVVSLGGIDLNFIHSLKDGSRKLVWFHFAIDIAETAWAGQNPGLFGKMKAKLRTWRQIYYARNYDKIVVISNEDLRRWKRYTDKVVLVYNPVTIKPFATSDISSRCVISVGRLCYQKGYDHLIDAWKIVAAKHPDWHLNIFGEGGMRDSLQAQINESNLSEYVTLCGRTSDIAEEYASHSIYVMSSRAEGLGLVLLEAASCGLPLVAYDCPSGPSEIIEDGKNGFLIQQVGDVHTMADRICQLIEDDELRRQMGDNARKMVRSFSVDKIRQQWIRLFNSL